MMKYPKKTRTLSSVSVVALYTCLTIAGCGGTQTARTSSKATSKAQGTISDKAITDTVEQELLYDRSVSLIDIAVSTKDGIVTLKGKTPMLLAKDRAVQIAKTVKGVRAVINNIDIQPIWEREDWEIEQNAQSAVNFNPAVDELELDIQVSDGKAIIDGEVQSWAQKNIIENIVKGVKGVKEIDDNVTFNDAYYKRADEDVAQEIEAALHWDVLVDDGLIEVTVDNGDVALSGTAGSAAEKSRAFFDAWVSGVRNVDDTALSVKYWARDERLRKDKYVFKADSDIQAAVERALQRDPRVFEFRIDTRVDDGIVTLRGNVDNLEAKRSALRDVRNTVGVKGVENRIRVQKPTRQDKAIASRIRRFYGWDTYVDRYDIGVSVTQGTAQLTGEVDSFFEKARADDLAAATRGVIRVKNDLEVSNDRETVHFSPYVQKRDPRSYDWFETTPVYTVTPDAQIREQIDREILWSPFVNRSDVNISVNDGIVTLQGTVESQRERREATEEAFEGGATWVRNQLAVN